MSGDGPGDRKCTAWPEHHTARFFAMMKETWHTVASQPEGYNLDLQPTNIPRGFEARKVSEHLPIQNTVLH